MESRFSEPSGSTLATEACERLRRDILCGTIVPGTRIHIREQCERLGIGLSPVREALNRLAAQGFVLQSDQRGFTAAPLNLIDLADLTLARAAVNEAALRDAIAYGGRAWEEDVVLAHYRLSRTQRGSGGTSTEWDERHQAFHETLLSGCRSGRLRLYCNQLFTMADRYRRVSRVAPGSRDVAGEHAAIMQAALARDADRAVILLQQHVERTDALVRQAIVER